MCAESVWDVRFVFWCCGVLLCGVWCVVCVVWCGVCGVCGVVWCGVVWCGVVWCGVVWCGVACGVAWLGGLVWWLGLAWLGLAWLGLAWLGLAWLGLAWLGLAWLGLARGKKTVCSFKTSPCVGSKRLRVYRQTARMCYHMRAFCRYTRKRFEHTEAF